MTSEKTDWMILPQDLLLEILKKQKRKIFFLHRIPFGLLLVEIMSKLKISPENFAEIAGVSPEFIRMLIRVDKQKLFPYPYEELLKVHLDELLKLMQALGFTIHDWEMAPDPRYYYYEPVAICHSEETMNELAEVRERYQDEKDQFVQKLRQLMKYRGMTQPLRSFINKLRRFLKSRGKAKLFRH